MSEISLKGVSSPGNRLWQTALGGRDGINEFFGRRPGFRGSGCLQGYLVHKKQPPRPRTTTRPEV